MRAAINASLFWVSFMTMGALVWASVYALPPFLGWVMELPSILMGSF